jgi:proteasome accessory factor B
VQSRKRIVFTYRPPGRPAAERHLDPYALVHRRGVWYVVGHDADRDAQRSFRLSRIESDVRRLRPTSRGPDFDVPAGFDPGSALPAGEPAGGPVALLRAPEAAARLAVLRGATPVGQQAPDGSVLLKVQVVEASGFVAWALGNQAEILEPEELRADARRRLQALLAGVEG